MRGNTFTTTINTGHVTKLKRHKQQHQHHMGQQQTALIYHPSSFLLFLQSEQCVHGCSYSLRELVSFKLLERLRCGLIKGEDALPPYTTRLLARIHR
eukprot:m.128295 g.128295  ORF g.128295 m.128295 type:complete len:97 (+) comp13024_c0_seq1:1578-1868(+)